MPGFLNSQQLAHFPVLASIFFNGNASVNLVKESETTRTYLFPQEDLGNGPNISMQTHSISPQTKYGIIAARRPNPQSFIFTTCRCQPTCLLRQICLTFGRSNNIFRIVWAILNDGLLFCNVCFVRSLKLSWPLVLQCYYWLKQMKRATDQATLAPIFLSRLFSFKNPLLFL